MRYVEHDDCMRLLLDLITDAPLLPAACGVLARVFIAKRVADAVGILHEWPDDKLSDRRGDLLGKTRELALGTRTHVKAPAPASIRHAAPVRRNR